METLSIIGIILGVIVLVLFAWQGWSMYICGFSAAFVVMIFSGLDIMETLTGPFMAKFAGFVSNYILLFMVTTLFAKILGDSGAAKVIAVKMAKLARRAPKKYQGFVAIMLFAIIEMLLTYGGINAFVIVFVMAALGREIFQEMDLPWHLYMAAAWATSSITLTFLPGAPAMQNLVPTQYLGTTPTAGPAIGIICSVLAFVIDAIYVYIQVRKCEKKGEGFLPTGSEVVSRNLGTTDDIPNYNVIYCLIPSVVMLVLLNIVKWTPVVAMAASCVIAYVMFIKTLPIKNLPKTITQACETAVSTCMTVAVIVGFGGVIAATSGYAKILGSLLSINAPPLITLVLAISVACGVTASSTGGLTIGLAEFADKFVAMGINPQVIHRISCIASTGLDSLPHNSGFIVGFQVTALTYRQGYKHVFVTCTIVPLVVSFVAVLLANMGLV